MTSEAATVWPHYPLLRWDPKEKVCWTWQEVILGNTHQLHALHSTNNITWILEDNCLPSPEHWDGVLPMYRCHHKRDKRTIHHPWYLLEMLRWLLIIAFFERENKTTAQLCPRAVAGWSGRQCNLSSTTWTQTVKTAALMRCFLMKFSWEIPKAWSQYH